MGRHEDVDNAIWSDPDFHDLSANAKLLYLWSWTNPRCGMAGLYKVSRSAIAFECGLSEADVQQALDELAEARFAFHEDRVMWVRSRVKHLRSKSPKMATSVLRDVNGLRRDHPLVTQFANEYQGDIWLCKAENQVEGLKTLSELSPVPLERYIGQGQGVVDVGSTETAVARELCDLLCELIVGNDPKAQPAARSKAWLDAARLLIAKDGRSRDEIERVIRWSQVDGFWHQNILSMPKLREKFPQLWLKMNAGPSSKQVDPAKVARQQRGLTALQRLQGGVT